ncbi:MAG: cytochrome c [Acidobacteria bacterium]|nr:cytochrome c [Acidobacteriota bacterium]
MACLAAMATATFAQTTGRQNPPLTIQSVAGRDIFEFYCAPCHGRDGRGAGPVVPALKTAPPDLTLIARRHGGAFPRAWVEAFVTHDGAATTPAHGSEDMPVWGPVFRGLDPSDTRAAIRIANVVKYVEALQIK